MIKSEIYRGKIYAGSTRLACTITIEQTAPMQLTVHAGTFIDTNGNSWTLVENVVFNLTTDIIYPTECKIEIGDIIGLTDVWCGTRLLDDVEEYDIPANWNSGHILVFPFTIPLGTINLSDLAIFTLMVLPGFPLAEEMAVLGITQGENGMLKQIGGKEWFRQPANKTLFN